MIQKPKGKKFGSEMIVQSDDREQNNNFMPFENKVNTSRL